MKKIITLITIMAFVTSCSDLEDLSRNKKDPSEVSGESLFTSAQKALVDQMVDLNVNNNNAKLWSQYLQETTYTDESNYNQTERNIPEQHWAVLYKDVLKDLDEAKKVITQAKYTVDADKLNAAKPNKLAIIEILSVFTYSVLVETFGDVPYKEALDINNLTPVYDDGLTIYRDLIIRLTNAVNTLNTSTEGFGDADRIYMGDIQKWILFGNSLKLRMGILLSDVDNALAKSTVEDAYSSGVFTSNADNAAYKYLSADPNTNPVHDNVVLSGRNDFVAAETIIDVMQPRTYEYLKDTNKDGTIDDKDKRSVVPGSVIYTDPRLKFYFDDNVDADTSVSETVYFGGLIGASSSFASHSHLSDRVTAATEPGILMDYAEVEFLLAEAAARTFNVGGTAKEYYDKAITASIEFWGGTTADATTFLALPQIDYDSALASSSATTPWKEVIGTQKWIALFNRGLEAWTSIRLLDFPKMRDAKDPESGYPNRYTYPIVVQTLNKANWSAASTKIGGDVAETKLFWDKN